MSRLLRSAQGEEGYETAAKYRYLVRTDSVSHTAGIHLPDAEIALRNSLKGRKTGGRCRASLRIR
ncbi:DUF5431 family protein [Enterobacter kobei]|nr:DUF5431 family protein [Enterobacter kobei]WJT05546.1 DUF5431 family protein [Leclercia adecarboxylata]